MAEVLLETDTYDVHIDPPQTLDVEIGDPMDKGSVITITKNGKHVVSEYDLAEVDVQLLPKQDKVVEITKNGVTEVIADDTHILGKVTINTDTTKQIITDYLNNGGTFAYYSGQSIPKIDWSKLDKPNYDVFFYNAKNLTNDDLQNFMNLYTDDKSFENATLLNSETFRHNGVTELNLVVPKGFKNSKNQIVLPTHLNRYTKIKQVTIDCNNSLENTGTLLGWSYNMTLTLLNTQNLKYYCVHSCVVNINRFYAGSLTNVPMNGFENGAEYFGGFIDLGKGLQQNGSAIAHTMKFDKNSKATRESILNIFNDLYDLNLLGFTFVNKPTIKLGTTVWKRVTEEDIKIATDKGWTVIQ